MSTAPAPVLESATKSPFKFLDYFEERDEERFGGRDEDIQVVVAGVIQSRSFVVYGPSGSGKTSLIRAGVIPELARRGYCPIYARTLKNPTNDFIAAVSHALELPAGSSHADAIAALTETSQRTPVIAVLDQFEEFFIRFRQDKPERDRLIDLLGSLLKTEDIDIRILFSLRQDYLAELDDFRGSLPHLFDKEYRLRSLTAFGARQAIASQLKASGVPYEPKFLMDVVDYLQGVDFDPTLLQIVCSEAWRRAERRDPDRIRLTAADIAGMEAIAVLFHEYLDAFVRALDPALHLTAKAILDALITGEDTKRAATLDWLGEAGFNAKRADFETVLDSLSRARLVRREDLPGETWYELIHDRLVDVVKSWLAADERFHFYQLARDLVSNEIQLQASLKRPEALLNAGQLDDVIAPQQEFLALRRDQVEFLFRSAVFGRSEKAVRYWADQLPAGRAVELLTELIGSTHTGLQHGAGAAAGWLVVPSLEERCIELALDHPSAEARADAAASVARMKLPGAARRLVAAGSDPRRRRHALGAYYLHGGSLKGIGPLLRWRVRRRARQLQDQAEDIGGRRKRGAMAGAASAVGWTYTAGILGALLITWAVGVQLTEAGGPEVLVVLAFLGGGGLAALIIGLLLGASASVGARWLMSRRGRAHGVGVWLRLGVSAWRLSAILGVIVVLIGLSSGADLGEAGAAGLIGFVLLWIPLFIGSWLAQAGAWAAGQPPRLSRWGWPLLFCMGVPVAAGLLIGTLVRLALPLDPGAVFGIGTAATALVSLSAFVLSRVGEEAGIEHGASPARTLRMRRIAVGTTVASTAFLLVGVGYDTLPFRLFVPQLVVDTAGTASSRIVQARPGRLGPGVPDVDYYRVRVEGTRPRLLELQDWSGAISGRLGAVSVYSRFPTFLVPPGDHWLTVGPHWGENGSTATYTVALRALPEATGDGDPADTTWSLMHFDVQYDSARGTGVGQIAGRLLDARPYDVVEVALFDRIPGASRLTGYFEVANAMHLGPEGTVNRIGFGHAPGVAYTAVPPQFTSTSLIEPDTASASRGSWRAEIKFVPTIDQQPPPSETFSVPVVVRRTSYATALLAGAHELAEAAPLIRQAFEYADRLGDAAGAAYICRRAAPMGSPRLTAEVCRGAVRMAPDPTLDPELYALLGRALIETDALNDGLAYLNSYLAVAEGRRSPEEIALYRQLRDDPEAVLQPILGEGETVGFLLQSVGDARPAKEYDLRPPRGAVVEIRVDSDQFDPVLAVDGPDFAGSDDDGGGGTSSRLEFNAGEGRPLRVRVSAFEHSEAKTGTFRITITYRR